MVWEQLLVRLPNYDALMEAAAHAWRQAAFNPEIVKTVCAAPYLQGAVN